MSLMLRLLLGTLGAGLGAAVAQLSIPWGLVVFLGVAGSGSFIDRECRTCIHCGRFAQTWKDQCDCAKRLRRRRR
jgi:hypothetical protein